VKQLPVDEMGGQGYVVLNEVADMEHTLLDEAAGQEPMVLDEVADREAVLDEAALEASACSREPDAEMPSDRAFGTDIIRLLNDSLATELVCVLRYKRHQFTADGLSLPKIAKEFWGYANEEAAHADRLAQRIVQLGGEPDFSPDSLTLRSYAAYDDSRDLQAMIAANLIAESAVIETYREIIRQIGDKDPASRSLVEDILIDEVEHAVELKDWTADGGPERYLAT
jgi:bacterioferritin